MNLTEIKAEIKDLFPLAKERTIKISLKWSKDELEFLDNFLKRKTISQGALDILGERISELQSIIKYLEELE